MKILTHDCQFQIADLIFILLNTNCLLVKTLGLARYMYIQYGSKTQMNRAHFLSISVHYKNEIVNSYTLINLIMKSVRKLTNSFTCNLQWEPQTNTYGTWLYICWYVTYLVKESTSFCILNNFSIMKDTWKTEPFFYNSFNNLVKRISEYNSV